MRKIIFANILLLVVLSVISMVQSSYASGRPIGRGNCCNLSTTSCPPIVPVCY